MKITFLNKFPDWNKIKENLEAYYNIYRNTNVIVYGNTNHSYVPKHNTTLTVKYAFTGDEYYLTNNCKFRVNKNNFLVLNESKQYESYIDSELKVESLAVFFNPEFVTEAYSSLLNGGKDIIEEAGNKNPSFFERLYKKENIVTPVLMDIRNSVLNKNTDEFPAAEQLITLFDNLIILQNEQLKEVDTLKYKKRSTREELYKRLNNAKDYILSCYEKNITLEELSKITCLEKHYMLREFKKYTGITPYKFITRIRLNEAKKLLKETSKTISEISALTGFEYLSSFSSVFTKHHNISPQKYRALYSLKSQS
jgi:AraC-like DNA-binding protein